MGIQTEDVVSKSEFRQLKKIRLKYMVKAIFTPKSWFRLYNTKLKGEELLLALHLVEVVTQDHEIEYTEHTFHVPGYFNIWTANHPYASGSIGFTTYGDFDRFNVTKNLETTRWFALYSHDKRNELIKKSQGAHSSGIKEKLMEYKLDLL